MYVYQSRVHLTIACSPRVKSESLLTMESLYPPPNIVTIVDNLFSYPYLRYCILNMFDQIFITAFCIFNISPHTISSCSSHSFSTQGHYLWFFMFTLSACTGFGMVLPHRKAAVFTARRFELLDVVQSTLTYLHPDSRVHSFLSPLPYQVSHSLSINVP